MENIGGDTRCSVVTLMWGKGRFSRSSCALDYAYKLGLLFWSDVMEEKIYSARIGSGDQSSYSRRVIPPARPQQDSCGGLGGGDGRRAGCGLGLLPPLLDRSAGSRHDGIDLLILTYRPADTGTNSISVSDFSGRQRAVLLQDRMEEPRAIVLHPGQG